MFEALSQETCYAYRGSSDLVKGSFVPHRKQEITVRKRIKRMVLFGVRKRNPPAMPVVAGDREKALAAANVSIQKNSGVLN